MRQSLAECYDLWLQVDPGCMTAPLTRKRAELCPSSAWMSLKLRLSSGPAEQRPKPGNKFAMLCATRCPRSATKGIFRGRECREWTCLSSKVSVGCAEKREKKPRRVKCGEARPLPRRSKACDSEDPSTASCGVHALQLACCSPLSYRCRC